MIKVTGEFTTSVSPTELLARSRDAARLGRVPALTAVSVDDAGVVHATFTVLLPLGRIPLHITVTPVAAGQQSVRLAVVAIRGPHRVDVDLTICCDPGPEGTTLSWTATVRLGGVAASVGQRVAPVISHSAINDVLRHLASAT